MNAIINMLSFLKKNLSISLPIVMALGVLTGAVFPGINLKFLILPFTILMIFPMMVTLNLRSLLHIKDGRTQILTLVINFGIFPFLAFLTGKTFFPGQTYMIMGFVMLGLIPTSGMTLTWTGFAKGNIQAAVKMMVIGLIIGVLAIPLYMNLFLGKSVTLSFQSLMTQLSVVIILPLIAGQLTRRIIISQKGVEVFNRDIKPGFPLFSTLGLFGIVFVAMALKAPTIVKEPVILLKALGPVLLLYLAFYGISILVGRLLLCREDAIASIFGTAMRNLSVALAIAMNLFGEAGSDIALILAIAFVVQVQSAAWTVKLVQRLFNSKKTEMKDCQYENNAA